MRLNLKALPAASEACRARNVMTDPAIRERLSKNAFFAGLSAQHLDFVAAQASSRRLARDELLFAYGQKASKFYLILSGQISVEVGAIEGPALALQLLGPGAVLGWSWLIAPYKWSFQARAVDRADVVEFDGPAILGRCEEDNAFGYELLKRFSGLMSERLHFAREKMMAEWKPPGFA